MVAVTVAVYDERMTNCTMEREKQMAKTPGMAGHRHRDRRYALQLDLRWKLVRRRRVLDTGTGCTLDLSSSGILLDAGRYLPPGLNLELLVSWPVLHRNVSPLQLFVSGRIVQSDGNLAAIQMVQHEFRIVGFDADQHEGAGQCVPELTSLPTR
jgi:hypothetical protein